MFAYIYTTKTSVLLKIHERLKCVYIYEMVFRFKQVYKKMCFTLSCFKTRLFLNTRVGIAM